MSQNRFYKTTKGFNAEVVVAKAVAYTTDADYKTFIANAVDGEIGVFNADTEALWGANIPITAGTRFFVAQKRDGGVLKTTPIIYGAGVAKKTVYTAPVKQVSTVTIAGTIGTEFKVGDTVSVKVIETTPGHEPFPTITYDYEVKSGDTVTTIATAIKNQINSLTDPRNVDGQAFVTASNAAGVLTLTAKYFGSSFRVANPSVTSSGYPVGTVVYTTPFKLGSGFPEHVASMEVEGQIYDGVTTQYPGDGFAAADFGAPTAYTDASKTYDVYHFTPVRNEKSPTPVNQHHHYANTLACIPTSGGPGVAISTIFGFTAPV